MTIYHYICVGDGDECGAETTIECYTPEDADSYIGTPCPKCGKGRLH